MARDVAINPGLYLFSSWRERAYERNQGFLFPDANAAADKLLRAIKRHPKSPAVAFGLNQFAQLLDARVNFNDASDRQAILQFVESNQDVQQLLSHILFSTPVAEMGNTVASLFPSDDVLNQQVTNLPAEFQRENLGVQEDDQVAIDRSSAVFRAVREKLKDSFNDPVFLNQFFRLCPSFAASLPNEFLKKLAQHHGVAAAALFGQMKEDHAKDGVRQWLCQNHLTDLLSHHLTPLPLSEQQGYFAAVIDDAPLYCGGAVDSLLKELARGQFDRYGELKRRQYTIIHQRLYGPVGRKACAEIGQKFIHYFEAIVGEQGQHFVGIVRQQSNPIQFLNEVAKTKAIDHEDGQPPQGQGLIAKYIHRLAPQLANGAKSVRKAWNRFLNRRRARVEQQRFRFRNALNEQVSELIRDVAHNHHDPSGQLLAILDNRHTRGKVRFTADMVKNLLSWDNYGEGPQKRWHDPAVELIVVQDRRLWSLCGELKARFAAGDAAAMHRYRYAYAQYQLEQAKAFKKPVEYLLEQEHQSPETREFSHLHAILLAGNSRSRAKLLAHKRWTHPLRPGKQMRGRRNKIATQASWLDKLSPFFNLARRFQAAKGRHDADSFRQYAAKCQDQVTKWQPDHDIARINAEKNTQLNQLTPVSPGLVEAKEKIGKATQSNIRELKRVQLNQLTDVAYDVLRGSDLVSAIGNGNQVAEHSHDLAEPLNPKAAYAGVLTAPDPFGRSDARWDRLLNALTIHNVGAVQSLLLDEANTAKLSLSQVLHLLRVNIQAGVAFDPREFARTMLARRLDLWEDLVNVPLGSDLYNILRELVVDLNTVLFSNESLRAQLSASVLVAYLKVGDSSFDPAVSTMDVVREFPELADRILADEDARKELREDTVTEIKRVAAVASQAQLRDEVPNDTIFGEKVLYIQSLQPDLFIPTVEEHQERISALENSDSFEAIVKQVIIDQPDLGWELLKTRAQHDASLNYAPYLAVPECLQHLAAHPEVMKDLQGEHVDRLLEVASTHPDRVNAEVVSDRLRKQPIMLFHLLRGRTSVDCHALIGFSDLLPLNDKGVVDIIVSWVPEYIGIDSLVAWLGSGYAGLNELALSALERSAAVQSLVIEALEKYPAENQGLVKLARRLLPSLLSDTYFIKEIASKPSAVPSLVALEAHDHQNMLAQQIQQMAVNPLLIKLLVHWAIMLAEDQGGAEIRAFWQRYLSDIKAKLSAEFIEDLLTEDTDFNEALTRYLISLNDPDLTTFVLGNQRMVSILADILARGEWLTHDQREQLIMMLAENPKSSVMSVMLEGDHPQRYEQLGFAVQALFARFNSSDQAALAKLFVHSRSREKLFTQMTAEQFRQLLEANPNEFEPQLEAPSVIEYVLSVVKLVNNHMVVDPTPQSKALAAFFTRFLKTELTDVRSDAVLSVILENEDWCVEAFRDVLPARLAEMLRGVSQTSKALLASKLVAYASQIDLASTLLQMNVSVYEVFADNHHLALLVFGNDQLRRASGLDEFAFLQYLQSQPNTGLLSTLIAQGNEACQRYLANVYAYATGEFKSTLDQRLLSIYQGGDSQGQLFWALMTPYTTTDPANQLAVTLRALHSDQPVYSHRYVVAQRSPLEEQAWRQLQYMDTPNTDSTVIFNNNMREAVLRETKNNLHSIICYRLAYQDKNVSIEHANKTVSYMGMRGKAALLLRIIHLMIVYKDENYTFSVHEDGSINHQAKLWTYLARTFKELIEQCIADGVELTADQLNLEQLLAGPKPEEDEEEEEQLEDPKSEEEQEEVPLLFDMTKQLLNDRSMDLSVIVKFVLSLLNAKQQAISHGEIAEKLFEFVNQGIKVFTLLAKEHWFLQADFGVSLPPNVDKAYPNLRAGALFVMELAHRDPASYQQLFVNESNELSLALCEMYRQALNMIMNEQGEADGHPLATELDFHPVQAAKHQVYLAKCYLQFANAASDQTAERYLDCAEALLRNVVKQPKFVLDEVFSEPTFQLNAELLMLVRKSALLTPLMIHNNVTNNHSTNSTDDVERILSDDDLDFSLAIHGGNHGDDRPPTPPPFPEEVPQPPADEVKPAIVGGFDLASVKLRSTPSVSDEAKETGGSNPLQRSMSAALDGMRGGQGFVSSIGEQTAAPPSSGTDDWSDENGLVVEETVVVNP